MVFAVSFELFLQCFNYRGPAGVRRAIVRQLFPVVERESEPDHWKIWYGEADWCTVSVQALQTDPTLIESLCAFRPCGDLRFWNAVLQIMQLGPVVLYFPGKAPPLVASDSVAEHLPNKMIEAMGKPCVVQSAHEILEIIKHA